MIRYPVVAGVFLLGTMASSTVFGQGPEQPAVRIRLVHVDDQLAELLDLFKGARAPSPAEALAAWKRASQEPTKLGKPLEALIAALNPGMVNELKSLGGSELSIRFDPQTGRPQWSAILPQDDGTFAALASALVLSGGAAEPPVGEIAVDRLAGPGSPLMARSDRGTLLASTRDGLGMARTRLTRPHDPLEFQRDDSGLRLQIERGSLQGSSSLSFRRLDQLLSPPANAPARLNGEVNLVAKNRGLNCEASLRLDLKDPAPQVPLSWFDWTPRDRAMVSFGSTNAGSASLLEAIIELADSIERLDPARAQAAPLKVRLDLLGRLVGIRFDPDLLNHLVGISGWIGASNRVIDSAFLVLHFDEQETVGRIYRSVRPIPGSKIPPQPKDALTRMLGWIDGQPLRICQTDQCLILALGEGVLEASQAASTDPERSSGPEIRKRLVGDGVTPLFGGLVWPGRLLGLTSGHSPLGRALAESSPISWKGVQEVGDVQQVLISVNWPDLDRTVKRFLELIPLDPPPDH